MPGICRLKVLSSISYFLLTKKRLHTCLRDSCNIILNVELESTQVQLWTTLRPIFFFFFFFFVGYVSSLESPSLWQSFIFKNMSTTLTRSLNLQNIGKKKCLWVEITLKLWSLWPTDIYKILDGINWKMFTLCNSLVKDYNTFWCGWKLLNKTFQVWTSNFSWTDIV